MLTFDVAAIELVKVPLQVSVAVAPASVYVASLSIETEDDPIILITGIVVSTIVTV